MKQTAVEYLKENSDWFDKSPQGENLYFESEVIRMMENYSRQTEISDEEIEKAAIEKYPYNQLRDGEFRGMLISAKKNAWIDAIRWYREQLKKKI